MNADCTVKGITFTPSEVNPGETLYVHVPKLYRNEVNMLGSLALHFNIHLIGGNTNNFLVQNVSRALVDKLKYASTTLQDTAGFMRIFSFYCMRAITTCCWRVFKLKNFVRFAQTPATKIQWAWLVKRLWAMFLAASAASGWTTQFWVIVGFFTRRPFSTILCLNCCLRSDTSKLI